MCTGCVQSQRCAAGVVYLWPCQGGKKGERETNTQRYTYCSKSTEACGPTPPTIAISGPRVRSIVGAAVAALAVRCITVSCLRVGWYGCP